MQFFGAMYHSLIALMNFFQEQIRREIYVTNELIVEQELHKARGEGTLSPSGEPPRSPLRRQQSEPVRPITHEVRFRVGSNSGDSTPNTPASLV